MMENSNRNLFRKALLEASTLDWEETEQNMPDHITFSRKHRRAMKYILRNKPVPPPISKFKKAMIGLVAALVALLAGCTMYINRNEIANFIEQIFEDHSKVTAKDDPTINAPEAIETEYTLGYVPDGYELKGEETTFMKVVRTWSKGNENIYFSQRTFDSTSYFDTERNECDTFTIDNLQIYYRESDELTFYTWTDNSYIYRLEISENLSIDDVISIISQIKQK